MGDSRGPFYSHRSMLTRLQRQQHLGQVEHSSNDKVKDGGFWFPSSKAEQKM